MGEGCKGDMGDRRIGEKDADALVRCLVVSPIRFVVC